ncbi:hypothetical protein BGZ76_007504 [Entomortierella beljakovae]|nr:hypothetical protein BGZ76_007504 [Entomortierella beljakovae]
MEAARPLLMIEGPKFSGFDFSPITTTVGGSMSATATYSPSAWLPTPGEPFIINGHRIVLPEKKSKKMDIKEGGEGIEQDVQEEEEGEEGLQDQEVPLSHTANTAKSIWDCSIILAKYLEALSDHKPGFWTGKRVLELGAGQGIASFSVAALGAERVIITDVESAVPGLIQGVAINGFSKPQVQVTALDWTDREKAIKHIKDDLLSSPTEASTPPPPPPPAGYHQERHMQKLQRLPKLDYILASDVIWVDYLIPALVDTMGDLLHIFNEGLDNNLDTFNESKRNTSQEFGQQHQQRVLSLRKSKSLSPVVLLAYQFRSTRSDKILFDSLDRLGLNRRKLSLSGSSSDDESLQELDNDDVYLDSKFRRSNLAIWKIWRD